MDWELTITRDGGSGEGIAIHEGKTVFVPYALAGERVRARTVKAAKNFVETELIDIVEKSPDRIAPFCPHYQICGGCSMQHMPYQKTLQLKGNRVTQTLRRIGGAEMEDTSAIGMEHPLQYRNKAVFPVINGKIGYFREKSRQLVEIEECGLLPDAFIKALHVTRSWLRENKDSRSIRSLLVKSGKDSDGKAFYMAALSTEGRDLPGADTWVQKMRKEAPLFISLQHGAFTPIGGEAIGRHIRVLYGEKALPSWTCGTQSKLSADSFQQVNDIQAEKLYLEVIRLAGPKGNETVVDAYCGAGVLTRLIAGKVKRVFGVEWNASAIENARTGTDTLNNIEFIQGDCGQVLPELFQKISPVDILIVDPPRKGCDSTVIEAVLNAKPEKLIYVSCDPSTLARDVKALKGVYVPETMHAVDMFPWTAHVETVVLLSRKED